MLKTIDVPHELRNFNKCFQTFNYKYDVATIFDDLLTIIICCFGRGTNEEQYFMTIKKYSKEELQAFTQLFGELLKIYGDSKKKNEWCDPLGSYYEALASGSKKSRLGQFFTPESVCTLMAAVTLNTNEWGKTICEPCSGSGRLVLAMNHQAEGNYYVCYDLDPICAKMTAINLCMHEIRGEVHCMDALFNRNHRFSFAINYEYWKTKTMTIFEYKPS